MNATTAREGLARPPFWFACMALLLPVFDAGSQPAAASDTREFLGRMTSGPAVFAIHRVWVTNLVPGQVVGTNQPPVPAATNIVATTNASFELYLPGTLNHLIWTNFIATTNGRSTLIWSTRTHPPDWPTNPATVKWNPQSLLWGRRGMTAICPSWEGQVWPGQVPITALTRRHGYARGHSMGPDGISTNQLGKKVWFLTTDNQLVEVKVIGGIVRTHQGGRGDYTVMLFDRDLPATIETPRVASVTNVLARYPMLSGAPWPFFKTEQRGHVSADVPGFTVETWKGGDSGSPNLLPLPGELVFVGGRSTSGPSPEMQADMDELCRRHKLDPAKYQMEWADLSAFPAYPR